MPTLTLSLTRPEMLVQIRAGDHVRAFRGLYWHHAIAVNGDWLIEFGSGVWGGVARYVHRAEFSRGSAIEIVGHPARFNPQETIQRAISQIGRNDFDILARNCEHFANWCATGKWESWQIQGVTLLATVAGLIVLSGTGAKLKAIAA